MRAVVLDAAGRAETAEVAEPDGPGALVHVHGCGLCGSDVEKLGRSPGALIGHELDGVLDDGTRVTALHRVSCGTCARCCAGHESTCEAFALPRLRPGGFAERVRATELVEVPETLPQLAGVWVEPLGCVLRGLDVVPRGRVLVVGCGAVGRLWVQALRLRGDDVAVAEPDPPRRAAAVRLGASDADERVDAVVLTAPAGVDAAVARLEPGGTLLVFAASADARLPLDEIYRRELHVTGSRSATRASAERAVELLPSLELPELTTLPLERFDEGVELYRRGDALKVVFTP